MQFDPPLQCGVLIRRYKRFLVDVRLVDGSEITLHCPNTGSMKNCAEPGSRVWFSDSGNDKRKYRHTWELVEVQGGAIAGINTARANALVQEVIALGRIPELAGYAHVRSEVKYGNENSRIDLLLEDDNRPPCFIEIKNVTLAEGATGHFPDAVTDRGRKHLRELMTVVEQGNRAILFFCVQHTGVQVVKPADHIDPAYGKQLREAAQSGVEVIAWRWRLSARGAVADCPLPVDLT